MSAKAQIWRVACMMCSELCPVLGPHVHDRHGFTVSLPGAMKMVQGLEHSPYEGRLAQLELLERGSGGIHLETILCNML